MRMKPDELCGHLQNNEYDHYRHDDRDLQSHRLPLQQRDDGVSDHATKVTHMRIKERILFYFFWSTRSIFYKDSFFVKILTNHP